MFTCGGQPDRLGFMGLRGGGGKGGGGGSPQIAPAPPASYTDPVNGMTFTDPNYSIDQRNNFPNLPTGADLLNQEIASRQAGEKATSDANAATAAQTQGQTDVDTQNAKNNAYYAALAQIQRQFQLQGVDPAKYEQSDIEPFLNQQASTIMKDDPNPAAAFPATNAQDILNNLTSGRRTQLTSQLNNTFTPDYTNNLLPDSTVNPFASQIVNEQFDPLSAQLTNARKRNTLNDTGYQAALDALTQKKTAALSQVNDLGTNLLNTDRSGINDIISGARSSASGASLTDPFDVNTYTGQTTSKAGSDLGNFGGALRSAVGDTKYADITSILNAGGAVQGANNPNAANPTGGITGSSPFFVDPSVDANKKRGLGNVGAF